MIETPESIKQAIEELSLLSVSRELQSERKTIVVNGYKVLESRAIWEEHFGKIPKDMMIHHINGNPQDNRIENLKMVTRKQHGKLHQKPNRRRIVYPNGTIKITKKK